MQMESIVFISFSYESFTVKSSNGHTTASIGSIPDYGLMRCTFANILVIKTQRSQILHSYTKLQRKSISKTYEDNGKLTALCLKHFQKVLGVVSKQAFTPIQMVPSSNALCSLSLPSFHAWEFEVYLAPHYFLVYLLVILQSIFKDHLLTVNQVIVSSFSLL